MVFDYSIERNSIVTHYVERGVAFLAHLIVKKKNPHPKQ